MVKQEKMKKKKPPYSVWQNLKFTFVNLWKWNKSIIFISVLRIPINVLMPLIGIYMSKYIVDILTKNGSVERLLLYILIFSLAIVTMNIINNIVSTKIQWRMLFVSLKYLNICSEKFLDADYEIVESPEGQTKYSKAKRTVGGNNSATQEIINAIINILSNIIGLVSYSSIIFTLNPLIVLLLSFVTILNYFVYKPAQLWEYRNRDKWNPIDRKINYIQTKAGDFSNAKDIRLYNIAEWFICQFKTTLKERMAWIKKYKLRQFAADNMSAILNLIRDGLAYSYLIYRMLTTDMLVSDFVLYFGIIGGFSGWLLGLINSVNSLKSMSLDICDLREFLEMPDKLNRSKGIALPSDTCTIEFRNVSFKYLGAEKSTIDNLSFTINKGEKIAIVGLNGAGKTTLIKLMCGLYIPSEGNIFVDGKDITEYNRDEYYTLFSVVFQDIHFMPVSIAKNIALCEENKIDRDKMKSVLKLSGFYDKVNSLPNNADTPVLKGFDEGATDLSGGEKQKLALSRALYKDGKIIVLDEPTAALDPIAEKETYQKYDELTSGRTAVYISHRLSSTRFCDRILFLENGQIAETGSHDELMRKNGKYAEMFDIQSHYYKEEMNPETEVN